MARPSNVEIHKENARLALRRLIELREIEACENSLREFFKAAWPVYLPGTRYIHSWHIDAITEHLEAWLAGDIRNLLINVPPRSTKSSLIAVALPAYRWIKRPDTRWLFSSFDLRLSKRDSRYCRNLIKSAWYQRNWGQRFKIVKDQDEKARFDTDKMGFRIASSVDAGIIGEGGDFIVYDDLNDINQMNSDAHIEEVIYYHSQVMSSRLNDPKTGGRLSVQQRSGERDITGYILETEGGKWEHLVIPNEFEERRKATVLGWTDPRTKPGELYCPERLGQEETEDLKRKQRAGYAGQYQQRPAPAEGQKFKREWWNYWNPPGTATGKVVIRIPGGVTIEKTPVELPCGFEQMVHGWDMAFKENKESDLVSGSVVGRAGANAFLVHRETGRWDFPTTLKVFRKVSQEFPCPEKMVEDKANGPAVIQSLRNEIPGIIESPIDGGLVALANSLTGYVEAGNVYLPNPDIYPWVLEVIEQFANFPNAKHDDDVSSVCHALRRVFSSVANAAAPEFRVVPRKGEPDSASHIKPDQEILNECAPHWRRWISVAPGRIGAALWMCETPRGAIRVYRELELANLDAESAGAAIARATMPDMIDYVSSIHAKAKFTIDLFMEKPAFDPIESVGSIAEMIEQGVMRFKLPDGTWENREQAALMLKNAQFRTQVATIEDGAWDRLRELLQFQPPDFKELDYDRAQAFQIARSDLGAFERYMAAVDGRVEGEYPKIKFAAGCQNTARALGAARAGEDFTDNFIRALLLGISAPSMAIPKPKIVERPWVPRETKAGGHQRLLQRAV